MKRWLHLDERNGNFTRHAQLKQTPLPTYLLTPCSRVLEKLTGFQLVKKFPKSLASSIKSTPLHHTSLKIHINIILSTPGSPKWSLSLRFPHQNPVYPSTLTHTRYMPSPSHSSRFYHTNNIG